MADETPLSGSGAPRRSLDIIAVSVLFLLLTLAFADVWFQGSCFFVRDLTRYYFPTKRILHDVVRGGEFPLWNRFYSAGQPAAANPEYEVFYPGQWPVFLRDYFLGYRLHILLHFYVAALAMYSLMRSLRCGIAAAMLTAVAFVLGGPLLSLVNLLPTFFCIAWMPLTFLFARRAMIDHRPRDFGLTALFFGLQALAFEPAVLLETAILIFGYAVYRGAGARQKLKNAGLAAIVVACGALVGAAQVLPTADFMRSTPRAKGLTFDAVSFWSMPPLRLGELLQPRFSGRNPYLSDDFWARGRYRQTATPYLQTIYLGYAVLIALVTGMVRRDRRCVLAVVFALAVWIVAFGENTPLLRMAFDAGLPMPLRFPERFAELAGIILTIAAGLVVDRIIDDGAHRATALRVSALFAVALAAFAAFTFSGAYAALFASMWKSAGSSLQPHWIAVSRIDWLLTAVRAIALCAVFVVMRRARGGAMATALVVFAAADLLPFTREIVPRESRHFFDPPAAVQTLGRPSGEDRVFFEPEWSSGPTSRRYFGNVPTQYWTIRNGMFPRVPAAWGFPTVFERDIDLTNVRATDELTGAMWDVRRSGRRDWAEAFMAMANVGHRAAYRPFDEETARHPDPKDVEPIVFVPVAPNSRYYFADEMVSVSSTGDFMRRMIAERHSNRAVYVSRSVFTPATAAIGRIRESANGVTLEVIAPARAFLVASVTWHKNWRATIDGVPAAIHPTNVAFQGVEVPPGRHTIVFAYRDPAVTAGMAISILALIAVGVLSLRGGTRRTLSGA